MDPSRICLYGWSEGTSIATQMVVAHPEIAGLILQGVVAGAWKDVFHYQWDLAVQFLTQVTDTNHDGAITLAEELQALRSHNRSTVSLNTEFLVLDPRSTPQHPMLNQFIDRNHDGKLEIATEIELFVAAYFANFDQINRTGIFAAYTTARQLPPVVDAIGKYHGPVLILQGGHDANAPPAGATQVNDALAAAGNRDHTLIVYPDLGHSLGPAATVFADNFAPIAQQPLRDVAAWLDRHTGLAPSPAIPGSGPRPRSRPEESVRDP